MPALGNCQRPTLLLSFINDTLQSVNDVLCHPFADDEVNKINEKLQNNVDSFSDWYKQDRLGGNAPKTFIML